LTGIEFATSDTVSTTNTTVEINNSHTIYYCYCVQLASRNTYFTTSTQLWVDFSIIY